MKLLNKKIFLSLTVIMILLLSSCSADRLNPNASFKDEQIFEKIVEEFFEALENNDVNTIKDLFSDNCIEEDKNLEENVEMLINFYSSAKTEFLFSLAASEKLQEDGKEKITIFNEIPIINQNTYYWVYLEYTSIDEFDPKNEGINQIDFYTADEKCIAFYNNEKIIEKSGLNLHIEKELEEEIRCIDSNPYKYTKINRNLNLEEVETFLKSNNSVEKFILNFGDYNCMFNFHESANLYYYELIDDDKVVYLELFCDKEKIIEASLYNDKEMIRKIV